MNEEEMLEAMENIRAMLSNFQKYFDAEMDRISEDLENIRKDVILIEEENKKLKEKIKQ